LKKKNHRISNFLKPLKLMFYHLLTVLSIKMVINSSPVAMTEPANFGKPKQANFCIHYKVIKMLFIPWPSMCPMGIYLIT
jgi:hypothetical protein